MVAALPLHSDKPKNKITKRSKARVFIIFGLPALTCVPLLYGISIAYHYELKPQAVSSLPNLPNLTSKFVATIGENEKKEKPVPVDNKMIPAKGDNSPHPKTTIAVVVCATAKGMKTKNFDNMALVKLMLPSLIKTLESDKQYQLFVGLDDDDDFWMSELNQEMLRSLATEMMKKQPNGDNSNFLIHFHGFPSKPNHIPFNEIIRTAKKQFNPDYYVRINDDTEFLTTQWATLGMEVLRSFSPPNVGAVGPRCDQGNVKIMTHDMVHKTHMEIFSDEYYPDVFDNWWLDDWISKVYGVNRTQKIDTWIVKHHTAHHGTRYGVNRNHQNLLDGELKKGNSAIKKWLLEREKKR